MPMKISEEMKLSILSLYEAGHSAYEVAKRVGVSDSRVRKTLLENGVKMRKHHETMKMSSQERQKNKKPSILAALYPDK